MKEEILEMEEEENDIFFSLLPESSTQHRYTHIIRKYSFQCPQILYKLNASL